MSQKFVPLFPPYLDKGSMGKAVQMLQIILCALGFNEDGTLIADGDYGEKTAAAVIKLQRLRHLETDGNFGPATRKALATGLYTSGEDPFPGIDVSRISISSFPGNTMWKGSDSDQLQLWPPLVGHVVSPAAPEAPTPLGQHVYDP